jgi:hypothetical protein
VRGAEVGVGGKPRGRFWAGALVLIAALAGGTSQSAFAAGPKPDPPPIKRTPPPPPRPAPPPPVYQPPPPVYQPPPPAPAPPPVYQAPPSGPTAAQILAAQRAAARAKAVKRAKAQRLRKQRLRELRLKRQLRLERLAAPSPGPSVKERRTTLGLTQVRSFRATPRPNAERSGAVSTSGSERPVAVIVSVTLLGALLIIGLGLLPATAAPSSRISALLEEHHGHFELLGGILVTVAITVAISFALTTVLTK